MTVTCGRGWSNGQHWLTLAVLLVIAFLGHDVLMAAKAAAEPALNLSHPPPARGHAMVLAVVAPGHAAEHPEQCHIGRMAVPRGGEWLGPLDHVVATLGSVSIITTPRADSGPSEWEEPHWPPNTRRALFQVYRN